VIQDIAGIVVLLLAACYLLRRLSAAFSVKKRGGCAACGCGAKRSGASDQVGGEFRMRTSQD
jgi:hypothetical protein